MSNVKGCVNCGADDHDTKDCPRLPVIGYTAQQDIDWQGDCTLRKSPMLDYGIALCRLTDAQRQRWQGWRIVNLFARLKQKVCSHAFAINDLKKTGADEDSDQRVSWPCAKCGKVFLANCGLDISPRNGPMFRKPTTTGEGGE